MSSNLKVNTILPSTGTSIGIGTAGGLITSNSPLSIAGIATITGDTGNVRLDLHSTASGTGSQIKLHNDHATTYFGQAGDTTGDLLVYNESNTNIRFFTNGNNERLRITSDGIVLVGTTNATTIGTVNKNLVVGSTTNNDEVGLTLNVMEGVHGRRVKLFLDDDDGVFGVDSTASTGVPPFVVRMATSEKFRITSDGKVGISSAIPTNILTVHSNDNNQFAIKSGDSNADIVLADSGGSARIRHSNTNFEIWTGGAAGSYYAQSSARRLSIDSNGNITKPSNPAFLAGRTGGNYTATIGTFPLNVARVNVGNHYSTSTYKFTAPVAGVYYFFAQVYYNNGNGTYRVGFRKEPSGGSALMLNTASLAVVGNNNSQTISIIESMGVGDTVRLFSDQNASIQCYYNINDSTYGAHTYFMGYLIG